MALLLYYSTTLLHLDQQDNRLNSFNSLTPLTTNKKQQDNRLNSFNSLTPLTTDKKQQDYRLNCLNY